MELALPQVQFCLLRISELDTDGAPLAGDGNQYVTDAFTEVTWNTVVKDGATVEEENACGELSVSYQGDPSIKWWDWGVSLITADPYLETILSRGTLLDLGPSSPPGFAAPAIGPIRSNGVSVEGWAKRVVDGDIDPDFPYAWWAFPRITQLRPGDRTFNSGAQAPKYVGRSLENTRWADGPNNDWPAASDRAAQWVPVTAASLPELSTEGFEPVPAS